MAKNATLPPIDRNQQPPSEQHCGIALNLERVLSFCFPTRTLEGDSPLGRLEMLARFGPLDSDGRLRAGRGGDHVLTAGEVKQMAYDLHARRWQRKLKREFVDDLVLCTLGMDSKSQRSAYGLEDLRAILSDVANGDDSSTIELTQLQDTVLKYVKSRFRKAFNSVNYGKPLVARMDNPVKEMEDTRALRKKQEGQNQADESLKQMTCLLLSNVVSPGRNPIDFKSTLQALGTQADVPVSPRRKDSPRTKGLSPQQPSGSPENRERKLRSMRRKQLKVGKAAPILWGSKQLTGSITRRVSLSNEEVAA